MFQNTRMHKNIPSHLVCGSHGACLDLGFKSPLGWDFFCIQVNCLVDSEDSDRLPALTDLVFFVDPQWDCVLDLMCYYISIIDASQQAFRISACCLTALLDHNRRYSYNYNMITVPPIKYILPPPSEQPGLDCGYLLMIRYHVHFYNMLASYCCHYYFMGRLE